MPRATPNQVLVASLLGTPLAGGWLLGAGLLDAARPGPAWRVRFVGAFLTVTVFALATMAPGLPPVLLPVVGALAMRQLARQVEGDLGDAPAASWGRVLGVAVVGLVVALSAMAAARELGPDAMFSRVRFAGGDEIRLRGAATEDDARKVEPAVRRAHWFGTGEGRSLTLEERPDGVTLAFVVPDRDLTEEELLTWRALGADAQAALGAPVTIELATERGVPRYVLRPEGR